VTRYLCNVYRYNMKQDLTFISRRLLFLINKELNKEMFITI